MMNLACKVHNIMNKSQQDGACRKTLKDKWEADESNKGEVFLWPDMETLDTVRDQHPLVSFQYDATIVDLICGGEHEDFGAMAVVVKEDGFLAEVPVHRIQLVEG